eukprot:14330755-Heterocapsa_arctica.AAC.1
MTPGTCVIEGMNNSAAYLDPIDATCSTGNTLDWFTLFSHYPVQLTIGGKLREDLGVRIRRPSAFLGITKK